MPSITLHTRDEWMKRIDVPVAIYLRGTVIIPFAVPRHMSWISEDLPTTRDTKDDRLFERREQFGNDFYER